MDEKFASHQRLARSNSPADRRKRQWNAGEAPFLASSRDRSVRRYIILSAFILSIWIFAHQFLLPSGKSRINRTAVESVTDDRTNYGVFTNYTRVPLEAHIMSKCPDARRCIPGMIVPAMERINDKVDFKLSFIGDLDPASDAVECMHGPSECLGNIIMLCAAHLYPSAILSLGFANCLVSSYEKIPDRDFVEECALEHGLDFGKINECISDDSGEGVAFLRDSVQRSQRAGVTKSCTVRVDGKEYCIVDGGKWKGCKEGQAGTDDLVFKVQQQWEKLND